MKKTFDAPKSSFFWTQRRYTAEQSPGCANRDANGARWMKIGIYAMRQSGGKPSRSVWLIPF